MFSSITFGFTSLACDFDFCSLAYKVRLIMYTNYRYNHGLTATVIPWQIMAKTLCEHVRKQDDQINLFGKEVTCE